MVHAAHDKISPTAKFVAYLRTFTDIPYSSEIATACDAEAAFLNIVGGDPQDFMWTAPAIEIRYKSVDMVLHQHYHKNIIELASGVSPRGLIWSQDKLCTYLETDLPEILAEKTAIVMDILHGQPRKQLQWLPVNAISDEHILAAESFFETGEPIAVLHEGLLPYLNREEKGKVARNIHRLLEKRGGVWITPDISSVDRLRAMLELDPKIQRIMETISGFTGRNIVSNAFTSMEDAEQFFHGVGFKVSKWKSTDLVPRLSSLEKVQVDQKKIDVMLERSQVWVMEVE